MRGGILEFIDEVSPEPLDDDKLLAILESKDRDCNTCVVDDYCGPQCMVMDDCSICSDSFYLQQLKKNELGESVCFKCSKIYGV